nr:unnamed protein product [Haemonchus contortus]
MAVPRDGDEQPLAPLSWVTFARLTPIVSKECSAPMGTANACQILSLSRNTVGQVRVRIEAVDGVDKL